MPGPSVIRTDGSPLSRADQLFFRFESTLNFLGGLVIFLIVVLTVLNVLGRWLFDSPISGYIDWTEQAMAFFAFLGIAYCQRLGGHIRMSIIVDKLHGRLHWFAELLSVLLMLIVTIVLIYGSYLHAMRAYELGDSSIDIDLPTWPAKMVIPIALSVLAIRLVIQIWAYIRAIREGTDHPTAVPAKEHAAPPYKQETTSKNHTNDKEK